MQSRPRFDVWLDLLKGRGAARLARIDEDEMLAIARLDWSLPFSRLELEKRFAIVLNGPLARRIILLPTTGERLAALMTPGPGQVRWLKSVQ